MSNKRCNVNRTYSFNPAGQTVTEGLDNETFAWEGHTDTAVSYTANGLNQYTAVAANSYTYDANGSLTGDGSTTFTYDTENRLISASGQNDVDLRYDPFGRLFEIEDVNGNIERLLYDGDALVAEYNASGAMLDRYVHGPGAGDDPLIWHTGPTTYRWTANYLYADRQGSIVEAANFYGNPTAINSYDEYGVPGPSTGIENLGRFRYTGQTWIPELGQYYYKARMYSPGLGRFMQTDPIGYADGMNMYRYVRNDPVNLVDPTGLRTETPRGPDGKCQEGSSEDPKDGKCYKNEIDVTGSRGGGGAGGAALLGGGGGGISGPIIVVTANKDDNERKTAPCSIPSGIRNIRFEAIIGSPPAGPAYISGTLTDPSSGASGSFHQIGLGGVSGLAGVTLSGTLSGGFDAVSGGMDIGGLIGEISFGEAEFGGSTATINNYAGDRLGVVDASFYGLSVDFKVFGVGVKLGAFAFDFSPAPITMVNCP